MYYAESEQTDNPIKVTLSGHCVRTSRIVNVLPILGRKQCVRDCLQNGKCKSVNYQKQHLKCELISAKHGDPGFSLILGSGCEYIEMENQPQEFTKSCGTTSCSGHCTSLTSGKPFCTQESNEKRQSIECPSSWQDIGDKKYCLVNNALSWQASQNSCISMGANLLAIETEEEQSWIGEKRKIYLLSLID
ncbi:uncharacterized protein LOC134267119 [Saccostrea cucullata]|uniref:uncharacterized protein LOC134267119 n=1 Tax=Saccostrea cuccullata TaxID=36930 RepID=UPI002ED4BB2D